MSLARYILKRLNSFLLEVLARTDLDRTTVIVTSDHGNAEDLTTRNHTRNPVPTLVWGAGRDSFVDRIRTLTDIPPALLRLLAP